MTGRRLHRRLARIAVNHGALFAQMMFTGHGWKIDIELPGQGGAHRIGSAATLREALRQAEGAIPGATMPLHAGGPDYASCSNGGCQHFRSVHGGPPRGAGCRFPGCPCDAFESWAQRRDRLAAEAAR